MIVTNDTNWLLLVFSLPTSHTAARMRLWRGLRVLGCGALRDGVSLLPNTADSRSAFERLAAEISAAHGEAHCLGVVADNTQDQAFRALFERTAEFTALLDEISDLAARLRSEPTEPLARSARALRRRFDALSVIDYFPSQAGQHVRLALADLEAGLAERLAPDEPRATQHAITTLDAADYRSRTWATRRDLWVDRVASAWLIRRHIDRKAQFLWLERPKACPKDALGFDFDGATFTHVGHRVTFETLLASFGLESDAGLVRLGGVIHALDAGGVTPPEAAGLAALLKGIKTASRDDDDFLKRATPVFDALHTSFNEEATL